MSVPANFTIVTLGVRDLGRAVAFYEALGWERRGDPEGEGICWFRTSGCWIGLFGRDALAEDADVPAEGSGFSGVTLAISVGSEAEADTAMAAALEAGARLVKQPTRTEWGGYSGYFADPDGHLWEIARNPHWPIRDGRVEIG
ncbi:MAG: VOC family protein [Micromonosporaceae bacterium]|nr:VOC family protein [Micromonosporaceae bacterium]